MKKKIILLGSTGSIGTNTLNVLRENKKSYEIVLLSTYNNINKILKQAEEFNVKNIIVNNFQKYLQLKSRIKNRKIKIFNKFDDIKNIVKKDKSIFYSMVSVSSLDGLEPCLILSKYSKNIGIVNKESLICGWDLIKKELVKYKTKFYPIDSEHYSIYSLLNNNKSDDIDRVFITASGGPFLNLPKKKFKSIKIYNALNHPNWKMGKKITIDSSTLMNKVFEVIEAKNIFNIPYNKISILTHPKSYVHAMIKFKNGLIKILIHEPDMKIPIRDSISFSNNNLKKFKPIDLKILNDLNFKKVDKNKFPLITILKNLPNQNSLFETILITVNDYFVNKFLKKEISYDNLIKLILKSLKLKEFTKFRKIKPKSINQIYDLRNYVHLKIKNLSI